MASWKAVLLFGLVLSASLHAASAAEKKASEEAEDASEDYADEERAFLVVRKSFGKGEDKVVQGRNLTVTLELHNAGNAAASSIEVVDSALPAGFELAEGNTKASFAKIDVGSSVKLTYTIRASSSAAADFVALEPAKVTYKAADGEQQATVSTHAYVEVITPTQQLQQYALTGGKYVSLGMLRTPRDWIVAAALLGLLAATLGGNSAYKSVSAARTNQLRKKALAALEKDA